MEAADDVARAEAVALARGAAVVARSRGSAACLDWALGASASCGVSGSAEVSCDSSDSACPPAPFTMAVRSAITARKRSV